MDAKRYTVEIEGFILGDWYNKGGTVTLTDDQARQFEREGRIVPEAPKGKSEKAEV